MLKSLAQANIKPEVVVGCSAGALVGAFYAAGFTPWQLEEVALRVRDAEVADFASAGKRGMLVGESLYRFVNDILKGTRIESMPTRFAAVAYAGEKATEWGITGWPKGEALKAAMRMFQDWLKAFGGEENREPRKMIEQIQSWIQSHAGSRLEDHRRPSVTDTHAPRTMNRAGWKKPTKETASLNEPDQVFEYLLYPAVFRSELCNGFDPSAVAKELDKVAFGSPLVLYFGCGLMKPPPKLDDDINPVTSDKFRAFWQAWGVAVVAAQLKALLRKVPEFEYLECYDFTYDLAEPRRFDDSYADVLLVLRKT